MWTWLRVSGLDMYCSGHAWVSKPIEMEKETWSTTHFYIKHTPGIRTELQIHISHNDCEVHTYIHTYMYIWTKLTLQDQAQICCTYTDLWGIYIPSIATIHLWYTANHIRRYLLRTTTSRFSGGFLRTADSSTDPAFLKFRSDIMLCTLMHSGMGLRLICESYI